MKRPRTRLDVLHERFPNVCLWFDGTGRVFVAGDLLGLFSLGYWSKELS